MTLNRLELTGEYTAQTPIRIGGVGGDLARDPDGRPVIPATTFRGALRASAEALLRGLDSEAMTTYFYLQVADADGQPTPAIRRVGLCCASVDKRAADADYQGCLTAAIVARWQADPVTCRDLDRALVGSTCLACRVFGAGWLAGRVRVADLPLIEASWDESYVVRGGVTLRRDTGTLLADSAYIRQALPAGTRFRFRLNIENATFAEQGLILLGLRAFESGWVGLGADRARGLGRGRLTIDWWNCRYVDAANLIDVLLRGAPGLFSEQDAETRIAAFAEYVTGLSRPMPRPASSRAAEIMDAPRPV